MGNRSVGSLHRLTARQLIAALSGDLNDGAGLVMRIGPAGSSWVLRYTSPSGKRREMGLGPAHRDTLVQAGASLTAARDLAAKAREQLRSGVDPLDARQAAKDSARLAEEAARSEKQREHWTLARCARDYHERVIEPKKSTKHAAQYIASLENHIPAALWHAPIDTIEPPAILAALLAIKPHERARRSTVDPMRETVQRIRQRLEAIFEDAMFFKRCSTNPAAATRRKLQEAAGRRERGRFRALPYREAPALMAALRAADGIAARCLEFTVLTASRTSEAILAEWAEFDLEAKTWTVPAARMKAKEQHTVFLSPRAVEIVRSMRLVDARYVFPSTAKPKSPMSNMAMLTTLNRLGARDRTTVHGLARATFSTWANETGAARPDVIEACLAHEESNRVRAAYNRSRFNEERRALLEAWAEYLAREPAQVLPFVAAAA